MKANRSNIVRHVILGNSVAGIAAAQEIRRLDPGVGITIVSDERTLGYSRAMLPLYIARKRSARELVFAHRDFYAARGIRLLRGEVAAQVDPAAQTVRLASGKTLPYDRLLVATGSSSRGLDVPGHALAGIYPLRKLADADAIKRDLRAHRGPIVIVGGGLVGVKSVEAFAGAGRQIHLLISSDRILSQMLDRAASDFFLRAFERHGVGVRLGTSVVAFHGRERVEAATLSDGTRIACDLAVIGKGVTPNVDCVRGTDIARNQGVRVDEHMATSVPLVYAAGDVAEPIDVLQGKNLPSTIWPSATEGGRIAGSNMAGAPTVFPGALRMNSVEILGVRAISAGPWEGGEPLVRVDPAGGVYRKLLWAEGRLAGFLLLGDVRCAGVLTALVRNRTEVSRAVLVRELERGFFSYRPRLYAMAGQMSHQPSAVSHQP